GLELGEVDSGGSGRFTNRLHVVGGSAFHRRPNELHAVAINATHVVGAQPILDVLLRRAVGGAGEIGLVLEALRMPRELDDLGDEFRARLASLDGDSGADVAASAAEGAAFAFAAAGDPTLGR